MVLVVQQEDERQQGYVDVDLGQRLGRRRGRLGLAGRGLFRWGGRSVRGHLDVGVGLGWRIGQQRDELITLRRGCPSAQMATRSTNLSDTRAR